MQYRLISIEYISFHDVTLNLFFLFFVLQTGEGVATIDDERIVQLTWEEKTAFVYNFKTLELIESFQYKSKDRNGKTMHEGWGITYDGKDSLIVSDGSNTLFFWDKNTYEEVRTIQVLDNQDRPVDRLNELEYAKGYIWANVW